MRCEYVNQHSNQRCKDAANHPYRYCMKHIEPCQWELVAARVNLGDPKKSRPAQICGKLPSLDSPFCPKHKLMHDEAEAEKQRWSQRMQAAKDKKKLYADMLEHSPLRADNPQFPHAPVDKAGRP